MESNIPLAHLTWFKTGGAARYFAQPTTAYEFAQAVEFAQTNKLKTFLLGNGANILISDEGFDGLVIQPQLNQIYEHTNQTATGCCTPLAPAHQIELHTDETLVTAQAGVLLPDLIDWCLQHNILGLEEFSGIPGTIGGAVYINVHYYEFLLEHFLVAARVIEKTTGVILEVDTDWFGFGYNQSKLHEGNYYLVDATFKLKKVTDIQAAHAQGRAQEIIRHRARRYPPRNTCGSFFRNFREDEVSIVDNNKKMIYVAYYLDKVGVKGNLQKGDAKVSYQHANMIVNQGGATSADIINVARAMQERVRDEFGVVPQPECQLIGFDSYPLL